MALRRGRPNWSTGVPIVAAVVAAVFSGLQWWEAHSGAPLVTQQAIAASATASASKAAAQAAQRQADNFAQQANNSARQAESAADSAKLLAQSVGAQRDIAAATRSQAISARDNIQSMRPWIAISFTKPPSFGTGISSRLQVTFKNMSDLPAEELSTHSIAYVWPYPIDRKRVRRELMNPGYRDGNLSKLDPQASTYGHPLPDVQPANVVSAVFDGTRLRLFAAAVAIYRDSRGTLHHSYACTTWYGNNLEHNVDCYAGPDD